MMYVQEGWTALIYASGDGHLDVVRLLLDRGANVHAASEVGYVGAVAWPSPRRLHAAPMHCQPTLWRALQLGWQCSRKRLAQAPAAPVLTAD